MVLNEHVATWKEIGLSSKSIVQLFVGITMRGYTMRQLKIALPEQLEQLELQKKSHVFSLFSELSWRGARGAEVNVRGLKLGKTHGDSFVLPTSSCWPTPPTKLHKSSWKHRHYELLNELRCSLDPPRGLASSKVAFQVHCDLDVSLGAIPQFDLKDLKAVQQ